MSNPLDKPFPPHCPSGIASFAVAFNKLLVQHQVVFATDDDGFITMRVAKDRSEVNAFLVAADDRDKEQFYLDQLIRKQGDKT